MTDLPKVDGLERLAALSVADHAILMGLLSALVRNGTLTGADIGAIENFATADAAGTASGQVVKAVLNPFTKSE